MHKGILSGCTSLNLGIKGPTFREVHTHTHTCVTTTVVNTHCCTYKKQQKPNHNVKLIQQEKVFKCLFVRVCVCVREKKGESITQNDIKRPL